MNCFDSDYVHYVSSAECESLLKKYEPALIKEVMKDELFNSFSGFNQTATLVVSLDNVLSNEYILFYGLSDSYEVKESHYKFEIKNGIVPVAHHEDASYVFFMEGFSGLGFYAMNYDNDWDTELMYLTDSWSSLFSDKCVLEKWLRYSEFYWT